MPKLTYAVCSYNRSDRLESLLPAMRAQVCSIPFEILVVDNNSSDATREVVAQIAGQAGPPIRYVFEPKQGIPYARNRAIEESMASDFMVFIDDDEVPRPGTLESAVNAFSREHAQCVGGKVKVRIAPEDRPPWLGNDLLGFLAETDHGEEPFWVCDETTPIWTANVGYQTTLFKTHPNLRFDARYNRKGHKIGGGSDRVMFRELIKLKVPIRYCPDMVVEHFVESWRLRRSYFLRLHFINGCRYARFESGEYPRTFLGVPPFMLPLALRQWARVGSMLLRGSPGALRQTMNAAHALGIIAGRLMRQKGQAPDASSTASEDFYRER